jgi:cytochrome c-type biogenesis protein CcmH/NrfG
LRATEGLLAADPRNTGALMRQAKAQALLGSLAAAETAYRRALAIDGGLDEARLGLAKIWLRTSPVQAEKVLMEVLDRDPHNVSALNNLGVSRDLQGKHLEAQEAYHRALQEQPTLASARRRVRILASRSRYRASRRKACRCSTRSPRKMVRRTARRATTGPSP